MARGLPGSALRDSLCDELGKIGRSFRPGELAYLALTSKPEFAVRDRLAFALHRRMWPKAVVSREWRRTDLAVLSADVPPRPLALIEAKASYTFDAAIQNPPGGWIGQVVKADLAKASALAVKGTEVYALVIVTHPRSAPDRSLRGVAKYLSGVRRAIAIAGSAEEVRVRALQNLEAALGALGPTTSGTITGGSAFGVDVLIDWWLVGP